MTERKTLSRSERSKADKIRRILATGEKLFSRNGFDGVTEQQIADEADAAVRKPKPGQTETGTNLNRRSNP